MYAVVGERILSCGTRLRATLFTEHIHGQRRALLHRGQPVQDRALPRGRRRAARAAPDAVAVAQRPPRLEAALHDETGAPISSCVLRTRGRDVATAPFQHWLSANDFSGAAVRVELAGQPGASWTSGEIAARITPLSSRAGRLSLVLRPPPARPRRRPARGRGRPSRAGAGSRTPPVPANCPEGPSCPSEDPALAPVPLLPPGAPALHAAPSRPRGGGGPGPGWPADEEPFWGELGGLWGAPGGPPHAGGGAPRPTRLG
eukprot:tig00000449_g929.t1